MKPWIGLLAAVVALIFVLAFAPVAWQMWRGGGHAPAPSDSSVPWQIDLPGDGSSRVLGLHLGRSTLSAARQRWPDARLALISKDGQGANLELFVDPAQLGFVQARLVVSAQVDEATRTRWQARAVHSEPLASGARRHDLHPDDLAEAVRWPVDALTLVPVVSLEAAVLEQRFGRPTQVLEGAGQVHWLYPDKGVAITRQAKTRDLIQYVAPAAFDRLRAPLLSLPASAPAS